MNGKNAAVSRSLFRDFLKYTSTNVLSMVGLSLYILADTYFIANGVGEDGLVALNLVLPVYSLMSGTGLMLGVGGAIRYAVDKGRRAAAVAPAGDGGEGAQSGNPLRGALLMGLMAAVVFLLLGIIFAGPIVRALGAEGGVGPLARTYLTTVLCFAPAFVLNSILLAFIRNDGEPRLAMAAMLTASMSNILLDYVFVFPLGWGIFGAAFATGLSPVISLCVLSSHFWRGKSALSLRGGGAARGWARLLQAGFPTFVAEFCPGLIILLFNTVILRLAGSDGVGAYAVIANVAMVCQSLFSGLGQGIQPLLSYHTGAGRRQEVRRVFGWACGAALLFGVLFFMTGLFAAEPMTALFNREHNPALAALAYEGIPLYFLAFLPMGISVVAVSLFASTGRPKPAFVVAFVRGFAALAPSLLLLSSLFGMRGVWLSVPTAEVIALLLCLILLWRGTKRAE